MSLLVCCLNLQQVAFVIARLYIIHLLCVCLFSAPIAAFVGVAVGVAIVTFIIVLVVVMAAVFFIMMRAHKKTRLSNLENYFATLLIFVVTVSVQTINWTKEEENRFVMCSVIVS